MADRETEKKRREVAEGSRAADAINAVRGTDYVANPSFVEPADVILESSNRRISFSGRSGRHHPS
jgi:hypothetical protein